ncbi:T9SS type A sorting domain-containing protein [Brumimicrobium aurantiacum]|uniref:T9SS C-terminal target domain-containing protein n=1 Tax=Brumimicrobium aurantiacum TaxID=1737063 RepID=A0A3E1EVA5_9FLAO|nr:T9SS type A sorting domain-containing protein [Brumimicrobium aurantiacum]RFC53485.1 T9SS C-terminal target domain-containing protein [Brumimicrobium aurantiacum]
MKHIKILLFTLFASFTFAQDGVGPLTANPDLFNKVKEIPTKALVNSFDSTFHYVSDTIALPFFDDFSRNKFQNYDADFGDANVTEELFYRMLDELTSLPLDPETKLTNTRTYRSEYDIALDTTIYYYFDSVRFLYDDLSVYEPNHIQTYAYPNYFIYDTIGGAPNAQDTVWGNNPEYVQDSARIFIAAINDPEKLWLNDQAYHNYRMAVNPWSLGVVTFDGLDEYGYPYNFSTSTNGTADTLYSKPLDLSTNSPADSVYFSFLYQTEGFGDAPESDDSLYLEFYSPVTELWQRVWRAEGAPNTDFKVGHVALTNPDYFQNGFQFRFMNYGSMAGALDHFHIDYVNLRPLSGYQDTLFKDFAIVYPISSLLDEYISVPWKHYRNNPSGKMGGEVEVTVRNGSELTENNQNGQVNVYYDGSLEGSFTLNASTLSGGNINYEPRTTYSSLHDFSTGYEYDPTLSNDTLAHFDYEGIASAQFPNDPINDTTFGRQVFENYYAYDDGTAEKAYGVTGEQGLLAYKFNAYQEDSLVAIQIHFVPSVVDVSNNLFLLSVWDDNNGEPGDLLFEDEFFYPRTPVYKSGRNRFKSYFFPDSSKIGVGETFYIGMRQIETERLNIGFDVNNDHSDKIFWSIDGGGSWNNSSFAGAVMMRPVVTSKMDYQLGIKTNEIEKVDQAFLLYPNPAHEILNIEGENITQSTTFEMRDLNGRLLKQFSSTTQIDISNVENGIYLINRLEKGQVIKTKKLVVH